MEELKIIRQFLCARERYYARLDPFRKEMAEEFKNIPIFERLRISLENSKRCEAVRQLVASKK